MHEALYYEKLESSKVRCRLCPHNCVISEGGRGICGIRINKGGRLFSEIYGKITSLALDPVEKKPLYRFHPGEYILSAGTKGCNLSCSFCQNWSISRNPDAVTEEITSEYIIEKANESKSFGIAYTYNEPFIWYEFVYDTAVMARKAGLLNVLVTNGFVNPEPLEHILPLIDAMNIDLKSFNDEFYRKTCGGSLEPVLQTIKRSVRACHVELTTLVIPTMNDSEEELKRLVDWIYDNAGAETPLHLSRYFPCYKMNLPPTPLESLKRAEHIAKKKLKYVYLGNVSFGV